MRKQQVNKVLVLALSAAMAMSSAPVSTQASAVKLSVSNSVLSKGDRLDINVRGAKETKGIYQSSNKKVASVTKKGIVTAKKAGTTKISWNMGGKKLTCKVKIVKAPKLSAKNAALTEGESTQIDVNKYGNSSLKVTWSCADTNIASAEGGMITGISEGSTVVTAKIKGKNKTYKKKVIVTVSKKQSPENNTNEDTDTTDTNHTGVTTIADAGSLEDGTYETVQIKSDIQEGGVVKLGKAKIGTLFLESGQEYDVDATQAEIDRVEIVDKLGVAAAAERAKKTPKLTFGNNKRAENVTILVNAGISISGTAVIGNISVKAAVSVYVASPAQKVQVEADNAKVSLHGIVDTLEVLGKNAAIALHALTKSAVISGENSTVIVNEKASIAEAAIHAPKIKVEGNGKIDSVTIQAGQVVITASVTLVVVADTVDNATVGGTTVGGGQSAENIPAVGGQKDQEVVDTTEDPGTQNPGQTDTSNNTGSSTGNNTGVSGGISGGTVIGGGTGSSGSNTNPTPDIPDDNRPDQPDEPIPASYVLKLSQEQTSVIANGINQAVVGIRLTPPESTQITDAMVVTVQVKTDAKSGYLSKETVSLTWNETEHAWTGQVMFTPKSLQKSTASAAVQATVISTQNFPDSEKSQVENLISNELVYELKSGIDSNDVTPAKAVKAEVLSADRMVLTFDHAVDAKTFYNRDHALANGANIETGMTVPPKYFNLYVRDCVSEAQTNTIKGYYYTNRVQAILQGADDKTLVFLFEHGFELSDNSKFIVDFTDMRKGTTKSERLSGYITDTDTPSVQKVEKVDMKTIRVYFDQPVVSYTHALSNKNEALTETQNTVTPVFNTSIPLGQSALNRSNFFIDGVNLSQNATYQDGNVIKSYFGEGNATIRLAKGYEAARNVIEITLGTYSMESGNTVYQSYFRPGDHVLQIANVGDYASLSETNHNNCITTQTFSFTTVDDGVIPDYTVEAQSPEQFVIHFNCNIQELAGTVEGQVLSQAAVDKMGLWLAFRDPARIADPSTKQTFEMPYETNTRNKFEYSWDATKAGLGQEIKVTRLADDENGFSRLKVEVVNDWTQLQDYKDNNKTYTAYELYIDFIIGPFTGTSLTNSANGVQPEASIVHRITGDAVEKLDETPPTVINAERIDNTRTIRITFDEPVQAGNEVFQQSASHGHEWTPRWDRDLKVTETMPEMEVLLIHEQTGRTYHADNLISYADLEDYIIDVEAPETIDVGTYTIDIQGVSDDYGNVCERVRKEGAFTVSGPATEFRVLSIFADQAYRSQQDGKIVLNDTTNTTGDHNAIYVEFSTQYAATPIDTSVLNTASWMLNGAPLPIGTAIVAGITDSAANTRISLTGGRSGVTITLPGNTLTGIQTTMVTLNEHVTDTEGHTLSGQSNFSTPSILDKEAMPDTITDYQVSELKNYVYTEDGQLVKDLY